jgi:hypothetical protein
VSAPEPTTELALVLDVGSAWAKAGIVGRARGRWRLVAHAAQPTAWGATELRRSLIEALEANGDPRLVDRYDDLLSGANRIECHTARRAARLAVVAVSREVSGSAARRAAEAAGWEVAELVTLDDGRSLAERLAALQAAEVDAWLVAGGFDDGRSPRALEVAALTAAARLPESGPVVWAGSRSLDDEVVAMFEPDAAEAVANPRPDARRDDAEALRLHLGGLLRTTIARDDESHLASITLPRALGTLAAGSGLSLMAVDIGASGAMLAVAEPDGTTSVRIHAGGGLAGAVMARGAAGRVSRLAGDAGEEATVADLLQTLRAHPASLPETPEELAAMQAAARMQIAALVDDAPIGAADLLIGSGATIARAPLAAQSARMLLDGVRPLGVTQLAIDQASLLGPVGSLADDELREAITLLSDDLLVPLGTSVVCRGGTAGQLAMRVTVHRAGWPTAAPVEVRVGQIQVLPLGRGQEAEIDIELGHGISLRTGRRSHRVRATATGGSVGLILDARGVPIGLPRRADDRRELLAMWRDALGQEAERGA